MSTLNFCYKANSTNVIRARAIVHVKSEFLFSQWIGSFVAEVDRLHAESF